MIVHGTHKGCDYLVVIYSERVAQAVVSQPVQLEGFFLEDAGASGEIPSRKCRSRVNEIPCLIHTEANDGDGEHGEAHVAQTAAAGDPDSGVIGTTEFAENHGQSLFDGCRLVA